MSLLLFTSFIAGVLTVLAPCILPILPIIIGGSVGSKKYTTALRIIGSLTISIIVFTVLLQASTLLIDVPPSFWKNVSGAILIFFGIITIFPNIWDIFWSGFRHKTENFLEYGNTKENGVRDIILGAALWPVFTSCSPTYSLIIATVLPVSLSEGILYIVAYALWLASILLLIAILGQRLVQKMRFAADPKWWFKKGLWILFLLIGLAIITWIDKDIEAKIIENWYFGITSFEERLVESIQK